MMHLPPCAGHVVRCAVAAVLLVLAPASAALAADDAHAPQASHETAPAPWVDAVMTDLDRYAQRYPQAFDDELQRYQAAPRALLGAFASDSWPPARRYIACALARHVARPCREVAHAWQAAPDLRFPALAAQHGMTLDAAETQLQADLRASYARWGRPLPAGMPQPR